MRLAAAGPQAMHKAASPRASVAHPTAKAAGQQPLAVKMQASSIGVGKANSAYVASKCGASALSLFFLTAHHSHCSPADSSM